MILTNIDQTGAQFNLRLTSGNLKQQSQLGGMITFLIYLASLAYAIYIFVLWGLGNILPKVTSFQKVTNEVSLDLPNGFIQLDLSSEQNPFKKENNILIPLIYYQVNGEVVQIEPQFSESNSKISLPDITLTRSEDDKSILIVFAKCRLVIY